MKSRGKKPLLHRLRHSAIVLVTVSRSVDMKCAKCVRIEIGNLLKYILKQNRKYLSRIST